MKIFKKINFSFFKSISFKSFTKVSRKVFTFGGLYKIPIERGFNFEICKLKNTFAVEFEKTFLLLKKRSALT